MSEITYYHHMASTHDLNIPMQIPSLTAFITAAFTRVISVKKCVVSGSSCGILYVS